MSRRKLSILERVIAPERGDLSPDAAREFLRLGFRPQDQERVDELSARAREGTLSAPERAELEEYILVADLLAVLKSKARRTLQPRSARR